MEEGNRVIYLENNPIDLNRDLGVIAKFDDENDPVVEFDDGFVTPCTREQLKLVVDLGQAR